jgi:hypothetical protein
MPVQAFVDESGGKGQGRHFALAGIIAHSEEWAQFSEEWRSCLSRRPAIRCFKMSEAAGCSGQFHGWTEKDRDSKLRELARIINRHAKLVTHSVIDLDAHAETWAISLEKPLNDPYFFPFHSTIAASCFELWDLGWRERFEIIFDEQVIFGPRARLWYPITRDIVRYREPEASSIMPIDPLFGTDDQFLPIQAADLFAWCWRRGTSNPNDRPFEWLLDEFRSVTLSEYSQYYDRERMLRIFEMSNQFIRNAEVHVDLVQKYRGLLGNKRRTNWASGTKIKHNKVDSGK